MKFGVLYLTDYHPDFHGPAHRFYEQIMHEAALAEALGFDSVWLAEHHFTHYGGIFPSPQILLAAVAQRTKRIRLGTAVVLLPLHNPVRVAEDFAMVDNLSDGRLEFGAGRAFLRYEYDSFNVSMEESSGRFREGLELIDRAWREDSVTYDGKYFQIRNLSVLPKPKQTPRPPIWAAAQLTPSSFELIGQFGYHIMVVPYLAGVRATKENLDVYRRGLEAKGHRVASREVSSTSLTYIAETSDAARAEVEPYIMRYIRTLTEAVARGGEASTARDYQHYREHKTRLQSLTFEQLVNDDGILFADPDQCVSKVRYLERELGLTYFKILVNFGGAPHHRVVRSLELFAKYVMPHFKA